jgi:hypothetical protein
MEETFNLHLYIKSSVVSYLPPQAVPFFVCVPRQALFQLPTKRVKLLLTSRVNLCPTELFNVNSDDSSTGSEKELLFSRLCSTRARIGKCNPVAADTEYIASFLHSIN